MAHMAMFRMYNIDDDEDELLMPIVDKSWETGSDGAVTTSLRSRNGEDTCASTDRPHSAPIPPVKLGKDVASEPPESMASLMTSNSDTEHDYETANTAGPRNAGFQSIASPRVQITMDLQVASPVPMLTPEREEAAETVSAQNTNPQSAPSPPASSPRTDVSSRRFVGTVKSFVHACGYGFIESDEIRSAFGGDAFLHKHQFRGLVVGDTVEFSVTQNKAGRPQARHIIKVSPVNAAARETAQKPAAVTAAAPPPPPPAPLVSKPAHATPVATVVPPTPCTAVPVYAPSCYPGGDRAWVPQPVPMQPQVVGYPLAVPVAGWGVRKT
eukprot:TRINITY_DN5654_c0_g2_i2.p1 TRINITY_DN5654_c0_g2~~TRINITY_DN5654_c0_g2_i2.p1  ORF type:complete len:326 (+),score=74.34 TRINITY_DN5654_c0_g2_i2:141-1118(+)